MFRKIAGIIVVALIALIGGAYMLPQGVHVERSTLVNRPAAEVFPYINSLRRANEWSPWMTIDPNVKVEYSGAEEGIGAKMIWEGNKQVGSGRQVITQSVPNRKVGVDLEFAGRGGAKSALTLTTTADGTKVVWSVDVDLGSNPIARYMGMSMDKEIGADYERGLAKLKTLVEQAPQAAAPAQPASAPITSPKAPTS